MPSRSRCAFGLSRYSATLGGFALLERSEVERLRLAALLALDQRLTDGLDLEVAFLLAPDQVADRFAVGRIEPGRDLGLDPCVLLLSQRDDLANSPIEASYFWCDFVHSSSRDLLAKGYWSSAKSAVLQAAEYVTGTSGSFPSS